MDKAGQKFWNESWAGSSLPQAVDPTDGSLMNCINRRFHEVFARLFARPDCRNLRLLEIGCAKSAWLPYFARQFGFEVCGIDYSPIGAQMAREVLALSGVQGEIVCADLFSPPQEMFGTFDVVTSFGVAEHFEDTSAYLAAAARFLKSGGMLITSIPNMVGWVGSLQKVLNRPVFDIHQLIDPATFRRAHVAAGLDVTECDYFVFTNFGVANLTGVATGSASGFAKKVIVGVLARTSMLTWLMEGKLGHLPANNFTSPYINCVARKP